MSNTTKKVLICLGIVTTALSFGIWGILQIIGGFVLLSDGALLYSFVSILFGFLVLCAVSLIVYKLGEKWEKIKIEEHAKPKTPKFDVNERQSGKTTRLLIEANSKNGIVICPTRSIKEFTEAMASEKKLNNVRVISLTNDLDELRGIGEKNLYIDNLDMILEQLFAAKFNVFIPNIKGISMTDKMYFGKFEIKVITDK